LTVILEECRLQFTGEIGVDAIVCRSLEWSVPTLPGEGSALVCLGTYIAVHICWLDHMPEVFFRHGDRGLPIELNTKGNPENRATALPKPLSEVLDLPMARKGLLSNKGIGGEEVARGGVTETLAKKKIDEWPNKDQIVVHEPTDRGWKEMGDVELATSYPLSFRD